MLTQSAQYTETEAAAAAHHVGGASVKELSYTEIHSLYECDTELPGQIRTNFKAVQQARNALFAQLDEEWSEKTDELFTMLDQSVRHHLRVVSEKMYVPVRKRLRVERMGSYERFKIFESNARKTNELIVVFLRKYHHSNQFFNTEFIDDVRTDMDRVVRILSEQLNRERAYLFPVYLTDS